MKALAVEPQTSYWRSLGGDNIWLPYTQMKTATEPLLAVATEGSRIRLADGRELIDGVASWWTACHGYNHPHIVQAMHQQLDRMSHVMFGGINHEPALRLAKRLAAIAPGDLSRVFFTADKVYGLFDCFSRVLRSCCWREFCDGAYVAALHHRRAFGCQQYRLSLELELFRL